MRLHLPKLFLKYLLGYLVVLLIPLLVLTAFLYQNTVAQLTRQAQANAFSNQSAVMDALDVRKRELDKLANSISHDRKLTPYLVKTSNFAQLEAFSQLTVYLSNSDFINEIIITLKDDTRFFTSQGAVDADVFLTDTCLMTAEDRNALLVFTQEERSGWSFFNRPLSRNGQELVVFCYPLPLGQPSSYGSLLILGYKDRLQQVVEDLMGPIKASTWVLDGNNQVCLTQVDSNDDFDLVSFHDEMIKLDQPGIYERKIGNVQASAIYQQSAETGWRCLTLISNRQFYQEAIQMRLLITELILLILAVGLMIAWAMTRRQVKPIIKIADFLNTQLSSGNTAARNEMEGIYDLTRNIVDRNSEMQQQMQMQRPIIMRQILFSILNNDVQDWQEIYDLAAGVGLNLNGPGYCMLVLQENDSDRRALIQDAADQFLAGQPVGYAVELHVNSYLAMIVNLPAGADSRPQLQMICDQLSRAIARKTGRRALIGVGGYYSELSQMGQSLVEAKLALEQASGPKSADSTFFADLPVTPSPLQEIMQYIDQHYHEMDFSLETISEAFGMSPSNFSRFFKSLSGVNFIQYSSRKRIERAKWLLVHTDRLIKDIVQDVGYTNLTSFTKKFKDEVGTSPGAYRDEHQETAPPRV